MDSSPTMWASPPRRGLSTPALLAVFLFTSWSLLGASSWSFYNRGKDPSGCEMTYMWPDYILEEAFRPADKYKLYLYKEADGLERERNPTGTPVLFIPGNAGSYKQARSLGSVLTHEYRRLTAANPGAKLAPFDVFTVDTNEELAAFQRTLIEDQALYVNAAIQYILELYPKLDSYTYTPPPTAVILIAHSMGGIVARTLPILPNYIPGSVNTIITMATPHLAPPAPLEARLARLYNEIHALWKTSLESETEDALGLRDITLLSLAGGTHDTMVSSSLVEISPFVPLDNGFTAYTSGAPLVWTAADHRAILWCNQVVKAVARALFGIANPIQPARTIGKKQRLEVFRAEFVGSDFDLAERQNTNEAGDVDLGSTTPASNAGLRLTHLSQQTPTTSNFAVPARGQHRFNLVSNTRLPPVTRVCSMPPPSSQAPARCLAVSPRASFMVPSAGEDKMTISGISLDSRDFGDDAVVVVGPHMVDEGQFVLAGIVEETNAIVNVGSEQFDFRGRLHVTLPIKSALTVVNVPSITTGPFKYTVRWRQQHADSKPLFSPVLHQSFASSSESKILRNPQGSLLTSYARWDGSEDKGLVMRVIADPAGGDLRLKLDVAWVESLGSLVGRYMMAMVAFGVAAGVQALVATVDVKAGALPSTSRARALLKRTAVTAASLYVLALMQTAVLCLPLPPAWENVSRGLLLGTRGAHLAFIPPLVYCLAVGAVVAVAMLVEALSWLIRLTRLGGGRLWYSATCLAILTMPAGLAYIVLFVQCVTTAGRARVPETRLIPAKPIPWPSREHVRAAALLLMLLQVFCAPGLVVWARAGRWWAYHDWRMGDVLLPLCALVYVDVLRTGGSTAAPTSTGKMVALITKTVGNAVVLLAFLTGMRSTYVLHPAIAVLFAWLAIARALSMSGVGARQPVRKRL
ncbi:GPI inositol deacylase [Geranomyces variabilis]|uniref:GPI inositol-deacylase n=1 Tax=Geranomyces variabilis TaxID=109894 RepID=A0AAD5TRY9_9FUNG|nr:GPI inositol deacylase [Geranomyces variabilis]